MSASTIKLKDGREVSAWEVQKEFAYRGNLNWLRHGGQKKLNDLFNSRPKQLFVSNVARQFGKTYQWVLLANEIATRKKNARIKYGAPFRTDLDEFIIPTFNAINLKLPKGVAPKRNKSGNKFIFPNGSEILLVGLDTNPDKMRGTTNDLMVFDEAGFASDLDYIYNSVVIPSTTHRPDCPVIISSTPPLSPAHEFVNFCQRAEKEGCYGLFTIYDNPMLNKKDIDRLAEACGGYDSSTFRREFLCEIITDLSVQIVPEWDNRYIQDISRDPYYEFHHKYTSMDIGVRHLTAGQFGYYDFKNARLVIEDEWQLHGAEVTTKNINDAVGKKEFSLWGGVVKPYRRVADNNNLILLQDLSSMHDMHFIATNKDTIEAMVNELRLFIQDGRLIVHPRCKMTIGCLRYGVWDEKKLSRNIFAESKVYGHFDHLAALIYLVRNLDTTTNTVPRDFGINPHTHFINNKKDLSLSSTAKEIKKMFKGI